MPNSLTRSIGARDSVDITALLYEGAFNRSPDDSGLDYWVSGLESGQLNASGLAASIVNSTEFTTLHASDADLTATVNSFYLNVLGREGDTDGLAYWVGSVESGAASLGDVLQNIALSSESLARNDAALHGFESAVSTDTLPGAPELETFDPDFLIVQTFKPLDDQFLNASDNLFAGDGTTPADGFSTVVDPANSGLLFGIEVMPRQSDTASGGTTAGYMPVSSSLDGLTFNVEYLVPSGTQSTGNGSFEDDPERGAVNSNVVVGLDDAFNFVDFLAAGNRITLQLDANPGAGEFLLPFDAVVDPANGNTLDFTFAGTSFGFTDFLGTDDTASEFIQQNFILIGGVEALDEGSVFDNYLTAYDSAGQLTQQLHWTLVLGPAPDLPDPPLLLI